MFVKSPESLRLVTLYVVHLTALIGIISLWNVADRIYFSVFLFLYLFGVYMDLKKTYMVRRLFLNLLGVLMSIYFLMFISPEDLLKPFSHVVLLLMSVKSFEEKKPRDLYQILLLSLFAISISTAYNLSFSFLFIFLIHSLMGVSALVFLNFYRKLDDIRIDREMLGKYVTVSLTLFAFITLLTFPFFFLLPRTQAPIFDFLSRGSGLKTGLTDSVTLGKVGEIQEDNTVVFRVYGLPSSIKDPYWRAIVFGNYHRGVWLRLKETAYFKPRGKGEIVYTIVMEPSFERIVPALDYPHSIVSIEGIRAEAYMSTGNTLRLDKDINRAIRLVVSSSRYMQLNDGPEPFTQVSSDVGPGLRRLAEDLSRGKKSDREKLMAVVGHFSQGYSYSLKLDRYEGDPLEHFLFVSRKGNCEYYASATALLLRLMGIPARVVGGFRGALWNQYGGYHIVTNSMAHVWVEAYIEGQWLRVDTTPPYTSPALRRVSSLALIRDSIVSFWYSNVIGYSSEKQLRLFRNIREGLQTELKVDRLRERLLQLLQTVLVLTTLYFGALLFLRTKKTPENLYRKTKDLLVREGLIEEKALPEEIILRCKRDDLCKLLQFIISIYQRYRYSPYRVYPDEVKEGYKALAELRKAIRNSGRS